MLTYSISNFTPTNTTNKSFSYETARRRLLALYGGACTFCGSWPEYRVSYDVGDSQQPAKRIERYCSSFFDKWQDRIRR